MTKKVYFIENSSRLDMALAMIADRFPCFLKRNLIEMDYSEISIKARDIDISKIEWILAPFM